MISTHFSSTSCVASLIHKLDHNDHKNKAIRIIQREFLTRIIAVSLIVFKLLDCIVHTAGLLESGIRATILYASGNVAENEWKNVFRHGKSISIFISYIPLGLYAFGGYILFPSKLLSLMENETVSCVNTMLLSGRAEYSKGCIVTPRSIVEYIEKHSKRMTRNACAGMEKTLPLLTHAKKYLNLNQFSKVKTDLSITLNLTDKLSNKIHNLRSQNSYKSLIAKIFCKEILTRLLSLGICITSLIDTIIQILSIVSKIQFALIEKLVFQSSIINPDLNTFGKIMLAEVRDLFIHLFGTITGPILGILNPDYGTQTANSESTLFDSIRFAGENPTKAILDDINALPVNQSILLPLSFRTEDESHIVYCLIDNSPEGYRFSTLNAGYGSNVASVRLEALTYRTNRIALPINWATQDSTKIVANYTFCNLNKEQLSNHLQSIQTLAKKSFSEIKKEAKNQNLSPYLYTAHTLYPRSIGGASPEIGTMSPNGEVDFSTNPNLMFCKPQAIGDCPRASLLAALNYHSSHSANEVNYQPFDQWIRHLKEHILNEDGYLIDMSLTLDNFDRGAYQAAREELDKSWNTYHSRY